MPRIQEVSPSIAARMSEMAAEILTLRARLAEVEELAERLAEVEAELDTAKANGQTVYDRMVWLEARLAAVEAVEAGNVCPHGFEPGEPGCDCYMCRVRAAAAGSDA